MYFGTSCWILLNLISWAVCFVRGHISMDCDCAWLEMRRFASLLTMRPRLSIEFVIKSKEW